MTRGHRTLTRRAWAAPSTRRARDSPTTALFVAPYSSAPGAAVGEGGHRGGVDHVAKALLDHARPGGPDTVEQTHQVDLDRLPPVLEA